MGSDQPRHQEAIIALPLASSGYEEQLAHLASHLARPGEQVMMVPRMLHDDGRLSAPYGSK
jgi:hypothetical protein